MIKISKEQQNEIQYEEKKTWKRRCMDYLSITAATAIYAVAVSLFMDPNSLAPGGITGIAIILNRITGLETGTWMFAVNIPILLLGMWKYGHINSEHINLAVYLPSTFLFWFWACGSSECGLSFPRFTARC